MHHFALLFLSRRMSALVLVGLLTVAALTPSLAARRTPDGTQATTQHMPTAPFNMHSEVRPSADPGDTGWDARFAPPGIDGTVTALAKRGSGPLYAGGNFTRADEVAAKNIAGWDGRAWTTLGSGVNGDVKALAVDGSGTLYASGEFTTAGGVSANNIARWDGNAWTALGSGMNGTVYALAVDGSGRLYAGGDFTTAGGVSANRIARWNGSTWTALGSGVERTVYALAVVGSDTLYAGGSFSTAGGVSANRIARWNGSTWTALGSGVRDQNNSFGGRVKALAVDSSGKLYAGGGFTTAGGVSTDYVARWDGSAWTSLGSTQALFDDGMDGGVHALVVDGSSALYAGSRFSTTGGMTNGSVAVARWDGSSWSAPGNLNGVNGAIYALAVDGSGTLYASGEFTRAGGVSANGVAHWDGNAWTSLGSDMGWPVALAAGGSGVLYAGGGSHVGVPAKYSVARWDGSAWTALGSGVNGNVKALVVDGGGALYAGGEFTTAGGVSANNIARWDGSAWTALGSGINGMVTDLAVDGSGALYASGQFSTAGDVSANYVKRWDGSAWTGLGSGINGMVTNLAVDGSGALYAGGQFSTAGGVSANNIARWDGSAWTALGSGINGESTALAVDGSGVLYAGGRFTTAGGKPSSHIARWDPRAAPPKDTAKITEQGGSLISEDGDVTLTFPANAVPEPVTVTYQELQAPLQPAPGDTVALLSFTLEARTDAGQPVTTFKQPYTLTFSYTDAELAERGINETSLNVAFWNGQIWTTLLPCAGCEVDTVNNRVTVILNHFTEFALLGKPGGYSVYLPMIQRQE